MLKYNNITSIIIYLSDKTQKKINQLNNNIFLQYLVLLQVNTHFTTKLLIKT